MENQSSGQRGPEVQLLFNFYRAKLTSFSFYANDIITQASDLSVRETKQLERKLLHLIGALF